jgi:HemY protein
VRKLLVLLIAALLIGAGLVGVLQLGSGYILLSFATFSLEMSAWTGLFIYLTATGLLLWLLLTWRWVTGAGGFRLWWRNRRSARKINQTAEGLLLFADDDWQQAEKLLAQSAEKSAMPVVNLLFAARAASDNNRNEQARQLLERLKTTYPKSRSVADKALAELFLLEEKPLDALKILRPIHSKKPNDRGLLRLLADAYFMAEDWGPLQKLLRDLKHYKVVSGDAMDNLELDVYCSLLDEYRPDKKLPASEQKALLEDIWYYTPKKWHKNPQVIAVYADSLNRVGAYEKQQALLIKALNNQWCSPLVVQYGELHSTTPEKQLIQAEKWLHKHPDDRDLLLALGLICQRLSFWGKARDYLSAAVAQQPSTQAYIALADVLEKIGDSQASGEVYRRGLLAAQESLEK